MNKKFKRIFLRLIASVILIPFFATQYPLPVSAKASPASLSKKQTELSRRLKNIKSGLNKKNAYKTIVRNNLHSLQSQIDSESRKLDIILRNIEQKENEISKLQDTVNAQRDELSRRICAIYKSGDTSAIDILLCAKDFGDFLDKADIVYKISKMDSETIQSLDNNLKAVEAEKAAVEASKAEAMKFKDSLNEKKVKLENIEKTNNSDIDSLKNQEINTQSRLNQIMLERQKLEEQISKFHSEYVKQNSSDCSYTKGRYIWPLPGFGHVSSPWGGKRGHKGIDISGHGVYGAPIVAAADGVVIKANSTNSWGSGWGYHVMISHGNGYATQYAHCSSVSVSSGQHVKAGQIIGRVGNTGHSFGAHLHFETWKDGKRYNPAKEL